MKRSSSLDCASIGQSLKRVKISTSPGELRLDRDIEALISGSRWTSAAQAQSSESNDGWPSRGGSSWDRRGSRIHGEIFCSDARLVRDPVDPLRLRLTYLHQPTSPNNSSPLPPERWMFLIHIPRMYPHVPPAINRVTRDVVPNNENMAHLGNMNVDCYHSSASAVIVASSVMQSHVEPPAPEQILIHNLPPHPNAPATDLGASKLLAIDLATSVFNTWSPVSSLQDLTDFLMSIPIRRREWWSVESNMRHHQQQRVILRNHASASGGTPVGQPTIAPATFGHQHFQPIQHPKQQQQNFSHCDSMEDDGNMNMVESMMDDGRHDLSAAISAERRVNPLAENRFDVGYDRGSRMRWGVR